MKVKLLKTGETIDCNGSYGARLIEQGKAVTAPETGEAKGKTGKGAGGK